MKKIIQMRVDTIPKVNLFVSINERSDCEIDVKSDRYCVNGKSILGVFSIPLVHDLDVEIHGRESDVEMLLDMYKSNSLL